MFPPGIHPRFHTLFTALGIGLELALVEDKI